MSQVNVTGPNPGDNGSLAVGLVAVFLIIAFVLLLLFGLPRLSPSDRDVDVNVRVPTVVIEQPTVKPVG